MSDRRIRVQVSEVHGDGGAVLVEGRAAELIALVACTALSQRTLGMLRRLASAEATLVRLSYACIQVDLTPTKAKCFYRKTFDQQSLGDWTQGEEDATDAA